MGMVCDGEADLVEMGLHGVGIGLRHHQRGALARGGADGAEQIGVMIALVGGLAGPCALARPQADLAVLLAQPGLVPRVKPEGRLWNQISTLLPAATSLTCAVSVRAKFF
jgi:hypothetical protein